MGFIPHFCLKHSICAKHAKRALLTCHVRVVNMVTGYSQQSSHHSVCNCIGIPLCHSRVNVQSVTTPTLCPLSIVQVGNESNINNRGLEFISRKCIDFLIHLALQHYGTVLEYYRLLCYNLFFIWNCTVSL